MPPSDRVRRHRRVRRSVPWLWVLVLGCPILGACGGGASPAEQADRFCTTWLEALVRHEAGCRAWSQAYLELQLADSPATCGLCRRSVAADREAFDSSRAARCLEETAAAFASCDDADARIPAVCDQVFEPHVPPGGPCGKSGDCIAGTCEFASGVCAWTGLGTCVALDSSRRECNGIPLLFEPRQCSSDEECRWNESSYSCFPAPEVGPGEPCDLYAGRTCRPGSFCADPLRSGVATCQPAHPLGGSCIYAATVSPPLVASPECAGGLVCGARGVCAQPVGQGAGCDAPTTECGSGLFCDQGVCASLPDLDQSCAAAQRCLRGACSSADGRCHALKGAGEACGSYAECASSVCTSGVCEPDPCPAPG